MKQHRSVPVAYPVGLVLILLAATLTSASDVVVSGSVRHLAVFQDGFDAPVGYEVTTQRYIVEVAPDQTGIVVPLDHEVVGSLCADKDGCELVVQMVSWDAGQPGNVASRTARLFLSESVGSGWWRISDIDISGRDDDGAVAQWVVFDCALSDAETYGGSSNSRLDAQPGFSLLRSSGGSYPAATCRVMLAD